MMKFSHRDLCEIGAKWLNKNSNYKFKSPYVAVELVSSCSESPDVFGMRSHNNILLEVKVSRSDFKADFKKPHRNGRKDGVGTFRYYLCPKGLIKKEELPEKWGLLYCTSRGNIVVIKVAKAFTKVNYQGELNILYSIVRRAVGSQKVLDFRKK